MVLEGGGVLITEVTLYLALSGGGSPRGIPEAGLTTLMTGFLFSLGSGGLWLDESVQGYLTYKKTHPPRTLPLAYA